MYQELSRRGVVDLEVAFLSSRGAQPYHDPGFGVTVTWNVDLLAGYPWTLLARKPPVAKAGWLLSASRWLRRQDIVVLHGHADPETLLAVAACRILRVPYLLRGESHAGSGAVGWRRIARHLLATFVVRGAAGALPIGRLNAAFYDRYGPIPQYPAPYSVDNDRFRTISDAARSSRAQRLESLGLDPQHPTVIFSGKLVPQKRPLDAVHAIAHAGGALNLVILGDGPLREEVRRYESHLPVRCLGFVNQAELPGWYASGDVLVLPSGREPWGVVVNEGMACGLIPVVSDAVGCASDLVCGVGEIFPVGDVEALAGALLRASNDVLARHDKIRSRLAGYSVTETAKGYEQAALALGRGAAHSLVPPSAEAAASAGQPVTVSSGLTSRAFADLRAVCGSTSPASAARWLMSLVARLPACARARSLSPADRAWVRAGARFRMANGARVSLLPAHVLGAREMYCRNVYLRTGLTMPNDGWVVDLGANRGLFSVWAAVSGAQAVAVEAQQGFVPLIEALAEHNGVRDRVHVEVAMAGGTRTPGSRVGVLSDDQRWSSSSHGTSDRPADVSVPQLMAAHGIGHIGLLKMDIEGGEFAVMAPGEDLRWLERVRQLALEVHPAFGDADGLIERLRDNGFRVDLRDNDGRSAAATSPQLAYAYCSRDEQRSQAQPRMSGGSPS